MNRSLTCEKIAVLTDEILKVEKEIDERVAGLYGL